MRYLGALWLSGAKLVILGVSSKMCFVCVVRAVSRCVCEFVCSVVCDNVGRSIT